jgi:flagellar biogenesis protein FliO
MAQAISKTWTSTDRLPGMPPIVQFVLGAVAWCRTKLTAGASAATPLRLVNQLALGGKRSLSLVEVDGVHFLVGGGAESVTVIVPVVPTISGSEGESASAQNSAQTLERGAQK